MQFQHCGLFAAQQEPQGDLGEAVGDEPDLGLLDPLDPERGGRPQSLPPEEILIPRRAARDGEEGLSECRMDRDVGVGLSTASPPHRRAPKQDFSVEIVNRGGLVEADARPLE